MKTATQTVGSHVALINFGGAQVPVGFIASFRKKNHFVCESGKGFTVVTVKGERTNHLCQCAVPRAAKKLREVGVKGMSRTDVTQPELGLGEDDGEHVVEVVGHAPRQSADALELL